LRRHDTKWLLVGAVVVSLGVLCCTLLRTQAQARTDSKTQAPDTTSLTQALKNNKMSNDSAAHWQELKNKWGWTIRFPKDWEVWAVGEDTPETGDNVWIQGPKGCFEAGERCGFIEVQLLPEDYWLRYRKANSASQAELQVDGFPAYKNIGLAKNVGGWPQGEPVETIVVNHKDEVLSILYSEDAKDRAAIRSASDWKLAPVFNKVLSTFSFIPATCHEMPCK
jgi:hypothetical protein